MHLLSGSEECLHGMQEVLGSSPGWAMCFFLSYCKNMIGAISWVVAIEAPKKQF